MWGMVGGARRQEILEGTSMGWRLEMSSKEMMILKMSYFVDDGDLKRSS